MPRMILLDPDSLPKHTLSGGWVGERAGTAPLKTQGYEPWLTLCPGSSRL